ncbi:hypothetical protein GN956_G9738 [Arapaima gigas]
MSQGLFKVNPLKAAELSSGVDLTGWFSRGDSSSACCLRNPDPTGGPRAPVPHDRAPQLLPCCSPRFTWPGELDVEAAVSIPGPVFQFP